MKATEGDDKGGRKPNGQAAPPEEAEPSRDIFSDLESLRFTGQAALAGGVEILSTIPVKKPLKTWFIRCHPDRDMYFEVGIWADPDQRDEIFLVVPSFTGLLDEQVKPVTLIPTITRQGTFFLWPCPRLSDDPGQRGPTGWGESARAAADLAREQWLRLQPDMQLGAYRIIVAQGDFSEPNWPEKPLQEMLRIAFGVRVIDREDHAVIKRLRGLILTEIPFAEDWHCDFEYQGSKGERPKPLCMIAREGQTGRTVRMWREQLLATSAAPFNTGRDAVMVSYSAHAELQCFKALGWRFPDNVIDLYAEHLVSVNGWELWRSVLPNRSMLSAMAFRGISSMEGARKDAMRRLILQRDSWSETEQKDILDYCEDDVVSSTRLLDHMIDNIDWPAALLRGRYSGALACMEWAGVPLDADLYQRLSVNWSALKQRLIAVVDADYGIYDGTVFKRGKFAEYLQHSKIPWPRLPSGALALDGDTFKDQARAFPVLNPLRELMSTIAKLRLTDLTIGADGRNRVFLNPYGSVTGRNQPSASEFIFGPAVWLRSLIRPGEGYGIAYCDWTAQEVAIAGALSGDECLIEDYLSGDVYMTFAIAAGLAPEGATKISHREVRDLCKILFLATNYGQTARGLAARLGISVSEAGYLIGLLKARYRKFTAWSQSAVDDALLSGVMCTKYGWKRAVRERGAENGRSLQNWPIQAAGGDMLRIACVAVTEADIVVCCPVHDALMPEGPVDEIEEIAAMTCRLMERAGQAVTGGLVVRAESKVIRWPDRFSDPRGVAVWDKAMAVLAELEAEAPSSGRENFLNGELSGAQETCAEHIGGLGGLGVIGGSNDIKGIRDIKDISDNKEEITTNINISPRTRARASRRKAAPGQHLGASA